MRAREKCEEEGMAQVKLTVMPNIPSPWAAWTGKGVEKLGMKLSLWRREHREKVLLSFFFFFSWFLLTYSVINFQIKLIFSKLSLYLWCYLVNHLPAFIVIHKHFYHILSSCPTEERDWRECLVRIWWPDEVNPK